MGALGNALIFLVSMIFTLYIGVVALRLLLALVRADFYNPLSQFIVTVTNPLLRPLRRLIPAIGRIDTAAIMLFLILALLKTGIIVLLAGMPVLAVPLVAIAVRDLVEIFIYIYIISLIGEAVLSWIAAARGGYNPIAMLLINLNRPLLAPIRRVIPPIGMVDLSPLFALLVLNALLIVLHSL